MERSELLARLGFAPPEACRVRVIIDTDAKNEGDDDFAILHHLCGETGYLRNAG